jgi:hypothetical protein
MTLEPAYKGSKLISGVPDIHRVERSRITGVWKASLIRVYSCNPQSPVLGKLNQLYSLFRAKLRCSWYPEKAVEVL